MSDEKLRKLQAQFLEPAAVPRAQSMVGGLLRQAHDMLAEAERKLNSQEKKIQQLEDLAATDPLTGLMNRRGFEKFFEHELARIRRHNSPGSLLVLIDLDQFKSINDTYGHQAGDDCLSIVSGHLLKSIRVLDGAARLGGDEFALLLTQTDAEKALGRVSQIRETLNDMSMEFESGGRHQFSGSLGVAEVIAGSSYAEAYAAADRALYRDKGRRKK